MGRSFRKGRCLGISFRWRVSSIVYVVWERYYEGYREGILFLG